MYTFLMKSDTLSVWQGSRAVVTPSTLEATARWRSRRAFPTPVRTAVCVSPSAMHFCAAAGEASGVWCKFRSNHANLRWSSRVTLCKHHSHTWINFKHSVQRHSSVTPSCTLKMSSRVFVSVWVCGAFITGHAHTLQMFRTYNLMINVYNIP